VTPGPDGKPGWGGSCFPKDISAIIAEAETQSVDLNLLKCIQNLNSEHRK
jgi:UDPglucose 6-dehydrogenase